jgi:hypothetical protein
MGFEVKHHRPVEMDLYLSQRCTETTCHPGIAWHLVRNQAVVIANKFDFTLNQNVAKKNPFNGYCAKAQLPTHK